MTHDEIEIIRTNVLHEITKKRQENRSMDSDSRDYVDHMYDSPSEAYIEGREAAYLAALTVVDKVVDKFRK